MDHLALAIIAVGFVSVGAYLSVHDIDGSGLVLAGFLFSMMCFIFIVFG